jgi:serine/threonine protein kinase
MSAPNERPDLPRVEPANGLGTPTPRTAPKVPVSPAGSAGWTSDDEELTPSIVFARFLGRRERGEEVDIEDVIREHPKMERDLRGMFSDAGHGHAIHEAAGLEPIEEAAQFTAEDALRRFQEGVASGQRLGPYELVGKIGEGAMGQVWEAWDTSLGRPVALKVIRPQALTARSQARLVREARAIARVSHPNIVAAYAFSSTDGVEWIAMQFVPGGRTLRALMREDDVKTPILDKRCRELASLFAQIADGMAAAHEHGIVHRDLKPENVLLMPDGRPCVTDFGLAQVEDEAGLTQDGDILGTWRYMSPEQVTGRAAELDGRSDVFSLGTMLFELLTGQSPFGKSIAAQSVAIPYKPHLDLDHARSGVPSGLKVIVDKCLEKRPEQRYSTMQELAVELRRFAAGEPVRTLPPVLHGRYERRSVIREDLSQRVLHCFDLVLRQDVVLELSGSSDLAVWSKSNADYALRHAQVLAALRNPGLQTVKDFFQTETGPVLVLEFVRGELLAERLRRSGPLEHDALLRLARELAATLAYVHGASAVHRGLTTECVLLRDSGPALLRGFRFAKFTHLNDGCSLYGARERAREQPELRQFLPKYPAPELFDEKGYGPNKLTDIFALGCVLFEAATGKPPFEDLYGTHYQKPVLLRHQAPRLDPRLAAQIENCLERNPLLRPQSAQVILDALGNSRWQRLKGLLKRQE